MMGSRSQKGIIPRLCDQLFDRIAARTHAELSCKVEVSYMEIYNEKAVSYTHLTLPTRR